MKTQLKSAKEIADFASENIAKWHEEAAMRPENYVIVTEKIRRIRPFGECRDDINEVIKELIYTNSEMWHEEDKVRSENDATVLKAIRNINPLNQHRNDLIEEIDEIMQSLVESCKRETE